MKRFLHLVVVVVPIFLAVGAFARPQANGHEFGFAVTTAQDGDLAAAVAKAQAACMSTILISIGWDRLHPDTLTWNADVLQELDLINLYFAAIGVKLDLQIGPVNTVVEQLPAELMGVPLDDPRSVRDMQRTLDTVFAHLPDVHVATLNISNESDALWGMDALKYAQFGNLMQVMVPYAKTLYRTDHTDTLSVGTTFTWAGLTDPGRSLLCQTANAHSDHISATYYGIQNDFTVKDPSAVYFDLDLLLDMQPGPQPIRLTEIGYPSSTTCGSNAIMQAAFVSNAMDAWDIFADRIPYMGWFMLTDWDSATVDTLGTYYGINDPVFLEYLRTLGLRTWSGSGTDKYAYGVLLCELSHRGLCDTSCAGDDVAEHSADLFTIAPNPATDKVRITGSGTKDGTPVRFLSMEGRTVSVLPFATEMDVRMLPLGAYVVSIVGRLPLKLMIAGH